MIYARKLIGIAAKVDVDSAINGQILKYDQVQDRFIPSEDEGGTTIFVQQDEPLEAPENSIWINTSGVE